MLSVPRILLDGTILSLLLGAVIIVSLYYNPRLWLQDYPKEMQAKVPPQTPSEKRIRNLLFVPVLLAFLVWPLLSAQQLRADNGGTLPFLTAYLHVFFVLNIFNLFDALVLDFLFLTLVQPKFAVLPGTEGMEYLYYDWSMHIGNYLKGIVFCTVLSAPIAVVAML